MTALFHMFLALNCGEKWCFKKPKFRTRRKTPCFKAFQDNGAQWLRYSACFFGPQIWAEIQTPPQPRNLTATPHRRQRPSSNNPSHPKHTSRHPQNATKRILRTSFALPDHLQTILTTFEKFEFFQNFAIFDIFQRGGSLTTRNSFGNSNWKFENCENIATTKTFCFRFAFLDKTSTVTLPYFLT